MSFDTGLTPIVAGTPLTLRPPVSTQQIAAVTIQNLSPLTLTVAVGSDSYTLAAYTADQYKLASTGQPVTITGLNVSGLPLTGVASNVDAIWYPAEELPDSGTYPATLNPDPLGLGLVIAEILLQQGIPSVLVTETLADQVSLGGGPPLVLDVSGQATIVITASATTGPPVADLKIEYQFTDVAHTVIFDQDYLAAHTGPGPNIKARLAVQGPTISLFNLGLDDLTVTVVGTNRAPLARLDTRVLAATSDQWSQIVPTAYVAGTTYTLSQIGPTVGGECLQGPVWCDFRIGDSTTKGVFLATIAGFNVRLCKPSDFQAFTATTQTATGMAALPAGQYAIQFLCTTSSAAPTLIEARFTAAAM